jgi:hypothetical protein
MSRRSQRLLCPRGVSSPRGSCVEYGVMKPLAHIVIARWYDTVRRVFWRPVIAIIAAVSALWTAASLLRHTIFSNWNPSWASKVVPVWHWETWTVVWACALILVTLWGCHQVAREENASRNALVDQTNSITGLLNALESANGSLRMKAEQAVSLADRYDRLHCAYEAEVTRRTEKFSFWLEVDNDAKPRSVIMPYPVAHTTIDGSIAEVNLVIFNEAAVPLKVLGFQTGRDEQDAKALSNHDLVGVPPHNEARIKATDTLMSALARQTSTTIGSGWNYSEIEGEHPVVTSIRFERDGQPVRSERRRQWFKAHPPSGGLRFEVRDEPFTAS